MNCVKVASNSTPCSLNYFQNHTSCWPDRCAQTPSLTAKKTSEKIEIDGALNEEVWKSAEAATDFWQYFPMDTSISSTVSKVRMTFDDRFLYVGFHVMDKYPGPWVTTSLRRDFRGNHNDVISVIFDPFGDKTNGIIFGINPYGVQREGLISGISGQSGARAGFSLSWDNKWYSEAKAYDGYWTAEMAIPFKTLRYKKRISKLEDKFLSPGQQNRRKVYMEPHPQKSEYLLRCVFG